MELLLAVVAPVVVQAQVVQIHLLLVRQQLLVVDMAAAADCSRVVMADLEEGKADLEDLVHLKDLLELLVKVMVAVGVQRLKMLPVAAEDIARLDKMHRDLLPVMAEQV